MLDPLADNVALLTVVPADSPGGPAKADTTLLPLEEVTGVSLVGRSNLLTGFGLGSLAGLWYSQYTYAAEEDDTE